MKSSWCPPHINKIPQCEGLEPRTFPPKPICEIHTPVMAKEHKLKTALMPPLPDNSGTLFFFLLFISRAAFPAETYKRLSAIRCLPHARSGSNQHIAQAGRNELKLQKSLLFVAPRLSEAYKVPLSCHQSHVKSGAVQVTDV